MVEAAMQRDARIFIGAVWPSHGAGIQRNRRGVHFAVHARDQVELPLQPLQLPDAQPDQEDRKDQGRDGEAWIGAKPHGPEIRPSPALCLYCSTSSVDLDSRRKPRHRITISGPHSTACTQ